MAASFGFGFKANKMHIGYSYDYQLSSSIMNYNYGTHEIVLAFYIPAFQHNRHTNFGFSKVEKLDIGIAVEDIEKANSLLNLF